MLALTRSLARELAPRTRVNAVSPGLVDTAMLGAMADDRRTALIAATPLGRLGTADEIARAVLFLAGPQAGFVTGAALHANGGMYMAG
ncbi:MAG: SDR family oxidoreductase [Marinibacterium sp.]|nr:SDR family oxidoreductase [Marinibacterium sp.]